MLNVKFKRLKILFLQFYIVLNSYNEVHKIYMRVSSYALLLLLDNPETSDSDIGL
jgi:hypothetical protein